MGYYNQAPQFKAKDTATPLERALWSLPLDCLELIGKLVYNCAVAPKDEAKRRIRLSNPKIAQVLVQQDGALEAMELLGWVKDEADSDFLMVQPGRFLKMDEVSAPSDGQRPFSKGNPREGPGFSRAAPFGTHFLELAVYPIRRAS